MSGKVETYRNGPIFDGRRLHTNSAARFEDGVFSGLVSNQEAVGEVIDLAGDILSSGYVDLQVNGGGGVVFNADPSLESLQKIAQAHRSLGVTALLPTLITDTAEKTQSAIAAAVDAVRANTPGIAGLHLEGPHLSVARKGAHDPDLIRPMEQEDLDALMDASRVLPVLKVTLAPENVTEDQVRALSTAGVLVSLGHTDADFETCCRYFAAGARCVTHLFNAMSQLGNREPGLVGATLATPSVSTGLIADAVHVHPNSMQIAWSAKVKPGRIFLVSDAMAVAGTDDTEFKLGGRVIRRQDGILTLADGTLAGADLDLTAAIRVMIDDVGVSIEEALRAAISTPADVAGLPKTGLVPGKTLLTNMNRISRDFRRLLPAS
jgi:N-acetylglucosamine-6-phosphate deacetylase